MHLSVKVSDPDQRLQQISALATDRPKQHKRGSLVCLKSDSRPLKSHSKHAYMLAGTPVDAELSTCRAAEQLLCDWAVVCLFDVLERCAKEEGAAEQVCLCGRRLRYVICDCIF